MPTSTISATSTRRGQDAARDIEAKLRRYAPDAEIHFERVAVTRQQVEQWNFPTRPTKMFDTRAKKFNGTSVELDAILAAQLRTLVRDCIERHVDKHRLEILRTKPKSPSASCCLNGAPRTGVGRERAPRLPNRRASQTFVVTAQRLTFTATISRFADGRFAEVFLQNHKGRFDGRH